MWLKIIIGLIILSAIDDYWEEKVKKNCNNKSRYRLLKGLVYFAVAAVSFLISDYIGNMGYIYIGLCILIGIGSVLSSINTNLREMYMIIVALGTIIGIVSFYYSRHRIIFTLIDIWMILGIITAIKEGIYNMRNGIDPDVIAEQKAAAKKFKKGIKLVKVLFNIWRY